MKQAQSGGTAEARQVQRRLLMLSSGSYKSTLTIRLRYLARHLAEAWDITIVVPSADKYNDFKPDYKLKLDFARLVQPWQLTTRSTMLNLIPYLFSSLVPVSRSRADVVFLNKPTPVTVLAFVRKLLFRTPVVVDLDDLGAEVIKSEGRSRLSYGLVGWCERFCIRHADAIVVASTTLRDHVRLTQPTKPVLLLPNGVEPGEYGTVAEQRPRHAVYFFGAINRLALVEDLLQAMPAVLRQLPDTRLTVVGGGTALDEAKRVSRELGIESAIAFTGWQADLLAVQGYTQFADVGVCYMPDTRTVRAASNMKVFQYMAMSTVPVVSDVGDLRRYVDDGNAGAVVPPGDVKALADELIELLQDEERRVRLAKEAWRLAASDHSWRSRADVLQAFLSETVTSRRVPGP